MNISESNILLLSDLENYSFDYDLLTSSKNYRLEFVSAIKNFSQLLICSEYDLVVIDGTYEFIFKCLSSLKNIDNSFLCTVLVCCEFSNDLNQLIHSIQNVNIDYLIKPFQYSCISAKISFYLNYNDAKLKKAHEDLGALKRKLEMREKGIKKTDEAIKILYGEILKSNEIAENAIKCKSDFLTNMSHEIRTPLNAITGMIHLAMQSELSPKLHNYLSKIDNAGKLLLNIVNDILDFSKIEAGKLNIESVNFNLDEIFENLSSVIMCKASEKENLEVIFDVDWRINPYLVGDPLRVEQVFVNLANNAIKFTDAGVIKVSAKLIEEDTGCSKILFSVQDTGIGITDEQQEKLFEAFSQADTSTTRKYGGTGLGLSICKQLVELMNGTISVESKYGEGSIFKFELTFQSQIDKKDAWILSQHKDKLRSLSVLVVGECIYLNCMIKDIFDLMSINFDLYASTDNLFSGELSANKNYDLVIIDINKKGFSQDKLKSIISKFRRHYSAGQQIIVMKHICNEDYTKIINGLGADALLEKPVLRRQFLNVIGTSLGVDNFISVSDINGGKINSLKTIEGAEILLVEDNAINQEIAVAILKNNNLNVTVANNGKEAIEIANTKRFDVVLMDIQMPVMDGLEATRLIRENKNNAIAETPIIGMTAHAFLNYREECLNKGMNDYVTKPIQVDSLFKVLLKWIPQKINDIGLNKIPHDKNIGKSCIDEQIIEISGIDTISGLRRINGNIELYSSLLVKFKEEFADIKASIVSAVNRGAFYEIGSIAHSIAGVSGNLGALELSSSASQLESAIKSNDKEQLKKRLESFYEQLTIVLCGVDLFFEKNIQNDKALVKVAAEKENGDLNILLNKIEELDILLKKRVPKPCKMIIEKLEAYNWPQPVLEKLERMKKMISKYKLKDAEPVLSHLEKTVRQELVMENKKNDR